jgi:ribosomal protein L19E
MKGSEKQIEFATALLNRFTTRLLDNGPGDECEKTRQWTANSKAFLETLTDDAHLIIEAMKNSSDFRLDQRQHRFLEGVTMKIKHKGKTYHLTANVPCSNCAFQDQVCSKIAGAENCCNRPRNVTVGWVEVETLSSRIRAHIKTFIEKHIIADDPDESHSTARYLKCASCAESDKDGNPGSSACNQCGGNKK